MVSTTVRNMQSADQRQRVEGIGCFDAGSFLKSSSTFQNFFTFALLPSSSAFLQTPKCVEYQPSARFPAVSSPLTSSSYLEPTPCFCPRCYLSQFSEIFLENLFFFRNLFFSPIALRYESVWCALNFCCQNACLLFGQQVTLSLGQMPVVFV